MIGWKEVTRHFAQEQNLKELPGSQFVSVENKRVAVTDFSSRDEEE